MKPHPIDLSSGARRKLRTVVSVTALCTVFAAIYPHLFESGRSYFMAMHATLNGMVVGFLGGLSISLGDVFYFQVSGRRLRFPVFLLTQTLFYLAVINIFTLSVMVFHYVLFHDNSMREAVATEEVQYFLRGGDFISINIYGLALIFMINFFRQINRMLGQNVLLHYFTGKYHKPVEEERVFMFLDLKASTSIAERLGHRRYHQFLSDFVYDITPAIVESKGEIYQYVGDEVVVTWTKENGVRNAECVNCYFRIAASIALASDAYERKYGFVPEFKAGYHFGMVTTGLIGDVKRDIVFHGDTVNTASRIRSECTVAKRNLLLSNHLLQRVAITDYLTPESIGKIKLKGKEEEIELYTIREAD